MEHYRPSTPSGSLYPQITTGANVRTKSSVSPFFTPFDACSIAAPASSIRQTSSAHTTAGERPRSPQLPISLYSRPPSRRLFARRNHSRLSHQSRHDDVESLLSEPCSYSNAYVAADLWLVQPEVVSAENGVRQRHSVSSMGRSMALHAEKAISTSTCDSSKSGRTSGRSSGVSSGASEVSRVTGTSGGSASNASASASASASRIYEESSTNCYRDASGVETGVTPALETEKRDIGRYSNEEHDSSTLVSKFFSGAARMHVSLKDDERVQREIQRNTDTDTILSRRIGEQNMFEQVRESRKHRYDEWGGGGKRRFSRCRRFSWWLRRLRERIRDRNDRYR